MNVIINPISRKLEFKLYQKEINKYLYLPPWSSHKKHVLINIIKNEIKRIILLNSSICTTTYDIMKFKYRLFDRGYETQFINKLFNINMLPTRSEILNHIWKLILIINII
jgi:hypothetical protein